MQAISNKLTEISKVLFLNKTISKLVFATARNYTLVVDKQKEDDSNKTDKLHHKKSSAAEQRLLHVAVIGVPNAGKSTFINNLIRHRICPTSCKVHTTRDMHKAIYTTGNAQLIFYDTPGLVTNKEIKKHSLDNSNKFFKINAYKKALNNADLIAVIHDVSNTHTRNELHSTVIETLQAHSTLPSLLILNKIDSLKSKRILLDLIRILTNNKLTGNRKHNKTSMQAEDYNENANEVNKRHIGWSDFNDVFMVSSITGNGLNDIHEYLLNIAKPKLWEYPSEIYTDYAPETLIVESVRARLLDYLPQEIPYSLKCELEYYSEENNTIYASVQVMCPTNRLERLICGESNGRLKQITERVTSDLVETFAKPISLTITTRSKKK